MSDKWAALLRNIDWERTVALLAALGAALAKPVSWVFRARKDAREAEEDTLVGSWERMRELQNALIKELQDEARRARRRERAVEERLGEVLEELHQVRTELLASRQENAALRLEVHQLREQLAGRGLPPVSVA